MNFQAFSIAFYQMKLNRCKIVIKLEI